MTQTLVAGAAATEITPLDGHFLFGYPHVERISTGVHDPLLSSALYLYDGQEEILFIANDIIFISKSRVAAARRRIAQTTSIPETNILISATHTHSGPTVVDCLFCEADSVVPQADSDYGQLLEDRIVEAGIQACQSAQPAKIGLVIADGSSVGTNRHDPTGPADPEVPVLVVRSVEGNKYIAVMLVCSMHPTVLHEDSTLVSADFPGMTRQYLQESVLRLDCPVLHHTGPSGNQSPRHVTKANTFAEASRLGKSLGRGVEAVLPHVEYENTIALTCRQSFLDLPRRALPSPEKARADLTKKRDYLEALRTAKAQPALIRTAECDWFGVEETLTLAEAAVSGQLDSFAESCLPAEIQLIQVGPWSFVGWPGEVFVEFGLQLKAQHQKVFAITLANGELQGYLVTAEAVTRQYYEAMNAIFASPESPELLVAQTLNLLSDESVSATLKTVT